MDAGTWSPDESPVIGLLEFSSNESLPATDAFESALAAADATIHRGELEAVLDAEPAPTLLVAAGESALSALARATATASLSAPVLPVGLIPGVRAASRHRAPDALAAALDGDATVHRRDVLEADALLEGDASHPPVRALFDLTLVTDEPASISEFSIRSRDEPVDSVRADGIVVATAAGTHGYASAVDAPELSRAVDGVAVAPIGPFVTKTRQWVLPDHELALTIDRDEQPVTLVADDRAIGRVAVAEPVTVSVTETLPVLAVPDTVLDG
ncbi:NAD(+)/NADH kinase [Natrialba taiwanensis]|uniref:ATP-NAD/AcoX kinase n=1 Tax=Natrialba taiwanensis DSM 12281 TaxID=1230458 RepID=L9ZGZ1_9EURY|nr:NAD(+)/NADH kinase [Natrialba taiwanensis]ELY85331.1 ATP-NAD/AcoX kinase [Natrialba taiwanensis DSM 12281]